MSRRRLPAPVWRAAYKAAWFVRKGVWYAPWPHLNGALAAVWVGDQVLVVRNSYNSYFTLPGGRLNRGETYRAAAARELHEETGVAVDPGSLKPVHAENLYRPFGKARVEIFEICLIEKPEIRLDPVEIAEFRWQTAEELKQRALFGPVVRYLLKNSSHGQP